MSSTNEQNNLVTSAYQRRTALEKAKEEIKKLNLPPDAVIALTKVLGIEEKQMGEESLKAYFSEKLNQKEAEESYKADIARLVDFETALENTANIM
ncbi:MAG: hypothetical protein LBH96_01810 [Candidatus Peribacteria bacterium]|jgi:hypothetical protein|nr:hypothetical protein [Candidatus Peribacteria bacterium]